MGFQRDKSVTDRAVDEHNISPNQYRLCNWTTYASMYIHSVMCLLNQVKPDVANKDNAGVRDKLIGMKGVL